MIEIDSLATFEGTFVLSKVFSKVRKYESTSYVYLYSQAGQRLTTGRAGGSGALALVLNVAFEGILYFWKKTDKRSTRTHSLSGFIAQTPTTVLETVSASFSLLRPQQRL